eukprot:COSAG01_NODE_1490_length_10131_cov_15.364135_4_plen_197_part_00
MDFWTWSHRRRSARHSTSPPADTPMWERGSCRVPLRRLHLGQHGQQPLRNLRPWRTSAVILPYQASTCYARDMNMTPKSPTSTAAVIKRAATRSRRVLFEATSATKQHWSETRAKIPNNNIAEHGRVQQHWSETRAKIPNNNIAEHGRVQQHWSETRTKIPNIHIAERGRAQQHWSETRAKIPNNNIAERGRAQQH